MEFKVGDKIVLIFKSTFSPTEEEGVIQSIEANCFVVQRKYGGTIPVDLDGRIPALGKGSYMKKIEDYEDY